MKFTLGWLKSHLDTTASLKEITDRLTAIGLELEGVADPAAKLAPFTVAYVVEAKRHPDADRLQVCIVDTGKEKVQVVCGAPNARTGMKGVFAPAGSFIPGTGIQLKAGNIRGQASNGMLVSMREMGLGNDHDGIIEMPADTPLGVPFAKVLGRDDPVIEIAITPNRADCLGVHGIARDLAASGLGTLRAPVATTVAGKFKSPVGVSFDFPADAQNACPLFVGRYIRGVKNGPSPAWLKQRLEAVGLRSISTLVDITNFFTLDLNRPLHVFDADTLAGSLVVRLARAGESLLALDGKSYTFAGGETVICDNDGVLSLGGVMGGESSGCSDRTVNVYLEVALFDPVRTAATGRRLQILSDARYRFERGLDPAFVMPGMEAATAMILELCGGEASEPVVTGKVPEWRREYALRPERINTLGGLDIPLGEAERILGSLGFETRRRDSQLAVTPPPWRGDVHGEADLVEEVARISGFDKIPAVPLPPVATLPRPALNAAQRRARDARRALAGQGLVEAVTYSFMAAGPAELFGGTNPALKLANPISSDLDMMRPNALPNLILAAKRNADRGIADVALFEVGPQYADDTPGGQSLVAVGIRTGAAGPRHWSAPPRAVDAFDAKGDVLALLGSLGLATDNLQVSADAPAWYHPGRAGALRLGPKTLLARFGEIHPGVLAKLDVKGPVVAFEVFLDAFPAPKAKASKARPLLRPSPFQAVERDFAFLLDAGVAADAVARAIRGAGKDLVAGTTLLAVSVFDVYQGTGVPEGKKSLAVSVRLQPAERTLTDAEIEGIAQRFVAAVTKATGATLRG